MDALLVVHMQVGLLTGKPKHDLRGVLDRINRLATKVRAESGKVILVQHCGGNGDDFEPQAPGWQFLPELVRKPQDIVLPTTLNDPFVATDLEAQLTEIRPSRVLVTGWATDFCVEFHGSIIGRASIRCRGRRRRPHLERSPAPRRVKRYPPS